MTDRVEDTIDYAEVCQLVALVAQQRSYRTLERLCSAVAERLLAEYEAHAVWVKAAKPEPPIPLPVEEVSVEVPPRARIARRHGAETHLTLTGAREGGLGSRPEPDPQPERKAISWDSSTSSRTRSSRRRPPCSSAGGVGTHRRDDRHADGRPGRLRGQGNKIGQQGVEAPGVLHGIRPSGEKDFSGSEKIDVRRHRHPRRRPPYEATIEQYMLPAQLEGIQDGAAVTVKYDPDDPSQALMYGW